MFLCLGGYLLVVVDVSCIKRDFAQKTCVGLFNSCGYCVFFPEHHTEMESDCDIKSAIKTASLGQNAVASTDTFSGNERDVSTTRR